jgi:hypothetical protein
MGVGTTQFMGQLMKKFETAQGLPNYGYDFYLDPNYNEYSGSNETLTINCNGFQTVAVVANGTSSLSAVINTATDGNKYLRMQNTYMNFGDILDLRTGSRTFITVALSLLDYGFVYSKWTPYALRMATAFQGWYNPSGTNIQASGTANSLSRNTLYIIIQEFDRTAGKHRLYQNGVLMAETSFTPSNNDLDSGANFGIGNIIGTVGYNTSMHWYNMSSYPKILTGTEKANIESYLKQRYGLTY